MRLILIINRFSLACAARLISSAVSNMISNTTGQPKEEHQSGIVRQEELRLLQNPILTHILTGILSFMLICAVVAFSTLQNRGVPPNDPSSIAAKANLLAGSKTMSKDGIAPGPEWLSDKQLRTNGTFAGDRFRLKWWGIGIGLILNQMMMRINRSVALLTVGSQI